MSRADRPPARLWFGRTTHTRTTPFRRTFRHAIAMLEVDIGRLDEARGLSRLFSVNGPNAIAFRETDHGARNPAIPLRLWAEARLAEAGVTLDGGQIRLVTFPRVLGYGFAPISIWFGYGPEGDCRGVIYEVHNTFGETHSYVSALDSAGRHATADKEFHVSPFWGVDGQYRFTLRQPGESMALIVENIGAEGRSHTASLHVRPRALTTAAILRWLVAMPMSGLGVLIAINWQALWIWMNGGRYHAKPEQLARTTTIAKPVEEPARAAEDLRKRA